MSWLKNPIHFFLKLFYLLAVSVTVNSLINFAAYKEADNQFASPPMKVLQANLTVHSTLIFRIQLRWGVEGSSTASVLLPFKLSFDPLVKFQTL